MGKAEKTYCRLPGKTAPKLMLQLPADVYQDVMSWAEKNARSKNEEIIARLIATLKHNDEFMAKDRLLRLIYSKKLAYKGK
ncbi:MAG: Arc-like binding domain [Gammaproteobacteria bacterium]|jgi:hypothetical protein|nr:Arc-like binding domain [Gammaproteobacteria bacterium]